MKVNPEKVLINVIELSGKECHYPMIGCLAYATKENFLGRVVKGYSSDAVKLCLMTRKAAMQLCHVQNELNPHGLGLIIYDAYRPLRAVKDFCRWCESPSNVHEKTRKEIHYPHLKKEDLIPLGYLADKVSNHCYGGSVDLSLIELRDGTELDMGTPFDYFGSQSHLDVKVEEIGEKAFRNRLMLRRAMEKFGFNAYPYEWWHFDYQEREVFEPMDMEITLERID